MLRIYMYNRVDGVTESVQCKKNRKSVTRKFWTVDKHELDGHCKN